MTEPSAQSQRTKPAPASAPGVPHAKTVAVVIAAWRASATIGKAVASALAQPETAEVVVVDDASADDGATLAAASAANDGSNRLKLIALETNGGPARARNVAIAASKAPWICILDSDDYMKPGRLAAVLAASDGLDFIADDLMQIPVGQTSGRTLWFEDAGKPLDISFADFVQADVPQPGRQRRELGFLKPLMRRAWLDAHSITYDERMRLGEDYDIYARSLAAGARFRLIPWTGYVSVLRTDSLSAHHSRADLAALEASDMSLLARPDLEPVAEKAVRAHLFSTRKRIVWIDFMTALKGGNPFRAAGIMLRDPRQAPDVIAGLADIAVRRLTGRKR